MIVRWWNRLFGAKTTEAAASPQGRLHDPAEAPLLLPTWTNQDLLLDANCVVGRNPDGTPALFDTMNPAHFGSRFLDGTIDLRWSASAASPDLKALSGFYPFYSGAMISPEMKRLFESLGLDDVEYIPLDIRDRQSGSVVGEWWFVNVFGWRDVFDFDRSVFEIENFRKPITGFQTLESRFGSRRAIRLQRLELLPAFNAKGLFLAKFPSDKVCLRVFASPDLAEAIRAVSPQPNACIFQPLSTLVS